MRLSPDQLVFWRYGFLELNSTIVTTWALMLVMTVGANLVTRRLATEGFISRWQGFLEIVVTTTQTQIKEVGLHNPQKYLEFHWHPVSVHRGVQPFARSSRGTNHRPARCRQRRRQRCVCSSPCRFSASRSKVLGVTSKSLSEAHSSSCFRLM